MKFFLPLLFLFILSARAQEKSDLFIFGDLLPDAPKLSERGPYKIGVRTLEVIHKNQVDILNRVDNEDVFYDRPLTLEVWYPSAIDKNETPIEVYHEVMGSKNDPKRPLIPFTFLGRALRDATPLKSSERFPLIIVSHGYPGSRYLLTNITENIASKGYVVVAIDHTDSTFKDVTAFSSTLLNRSMDVLYVLNEISKMNRLKNHFLYSYVDTDRTGLIGYSLGGCGVLNIGGAGYSPTSVDLFKRMTKGSRVLEKQMIGNSSYEASIDSRIKAIVAIAPWGMENNLWNMEGLKGLKIPTLFIAGNKDDISGYKKGTKAIYEGAINSDRYLLTYENARHNVAPNPAPVEALKKGLDINEYLRYADSVWDQRRINNINQHFITAFLGIKLKNKAEYLPYLGVAKIKTQSQWEGFKSRTSVGLQLDYSPSQNVEK